MSKLEDKPEPEEDKNSYNLSFSISSSKRDFFVMFNFFHVTHPFRLFSMNSHYDLTTISRDDGYGLSRRNRDER
jgi:hypothetical protein